MSHKNCGCNECTVETREVAKQPIKLMEPPADGYVFTSAEPTAGLGGSQASSKETIRVASAYKDLADRLYGPKSFKTIDTGNKETFSTGMQRNSAEGKPRYDLIWKPGLKRVAELYARGAKIYGDRNWEKASTQEEMDRFDESLLRHTFQLLEGDRSEDHMSALIFNAFGREMVRAKLNGEVK